MVVKNRGHYALFLVFGGVAKAVSRAENLIKFGLGIFGDFSKVSEIWIPGFLYRTWKADWAMKQFLSQFLTSLLGPCRGIGRSGRKSLCFNRGMCAKNYGRLRGFYFLGAQVYWGGFF